jgi:4-carboxymuconolactone decarboxylase
MPADDERRRDMVEYLPDIYRRFRDEQPGVMAAYTALAEAAHAAGPLSDRERRLVKLGIAMGAASEGGVRSHVRKALTEGLGPDELRHAAILAITTAGFPQAMAAYRWVSEVLDAEA